MKPEPIAPAEAMRTDGAVHRRTARAVAKYDSEIGYVDHFIEKLYRIYGWDRETLLIVTSDHGEGFNEHGDAGHGKNLYDEVL